MKTRRLYRILLLLTVLLSFGFGVSAFADHIEIADRQWAATVRDARRVDSLTLETIDLGTNTLTPAARIKFAAIAEEQVQIWGDTILEGDYQAENRVQIDSIEMVVLNSVVIGYRIVYSSVALDTSNCDANKDFTECTTGRIVEATFVSLSLDSWIRDDQQLAEFVSP